MSTTGHVTEIVWVFARSIVCIGIRIVWCCACVCITYNGKPNLLSSRSVMCINGYMTTSNSYKSVYVVEKGWNYHHASCYALTHSIMQFEHWCKQQHSCAVGGESYVWEKFCEFHVSSSIYGTFTPVCYVVTCCTLYFTNTLKHQKIRKGI